MNYYDNNTQINQVSRADFQSLVLGYLGVGLGLGAVGAYLGNYFLPRMGSAASLVMIACLLVEMILCFVIGRRLESRSTAVVRGMFIAYSLINGVTLSVIIASYTETSVLLAFVTTAVVFVSLCAIGKTTKVDLTRFGSLFLIGLVVCLILSLINLFFFHASGMEIALCYIETLIFMGITAYDMQMIDRYYASSENENYAIFAALQLELDFINLLIRILQIFGRRRDD